MNRRMEISRETWPLQKPFIIARGKRTETQVVTVTIHEGGYLGRGEGTPSPRYGENCDSVVEQIERLDQQIQEGLSQEKLQLVLEPGAARNAVDAALWDLEVKKTGKNIAEITGLPWPDDLKTVETISILPVEEMAREARRLRNFPIIKVKLNAESILDRIKAVRENAPTSELLVDANESWTLDILRDVAPKLKDLGVVFIEQPLPAGKDDLLEGYECPLPLGADESCHTSADLDYLLGKYDFINIKLDKTGGLSEAIQLEQKAREMGFGVMVGCMLSTSLGIAPAMFLAAKAKYVDLDAPALLSRDRDFHLTIHKGKMSPLNRMLWGG